MKANMLENKAIIRKLLICSMILIAMVTTAQAQDSIRPQPKFWVGLSGAANFNFYTGTTQTLNSTVFAPAAFHKGSGVGLFASALVEYRPNALWGLLLNLGYDNRGGKFDGVIAPCNCPATLSTKISYLTLEPSFRIAPFKSNFYLFLGPSLNFNLGKSFKYTQELQPDAEGDFSDMRKVLLTAQIGAGYDISLTDANRQTQVQLSPFISYHPYFGQSPRSIESWSVTTIRVGLALKFGQSKVPPPPPEVIEPVEVAIVPPVVVHEVGFTIIAPLIVPEKRKVKETFPIRNYVFFTEGSTNIPNRYVLLNNQQAAAFKIDQFQDPEPKDTAGRSDRQLTIYYNILNILGARMRDNPNARITLIGSSAGKGSEIGKASAESVKRYLVDVFGISGTRIIVEGRNQPIIESEQPGGMIDLEMLRDGDRRVDIVSDSSPDLMSPLQIVEVKRDPIESRIIFRTDAGEKESLKSWSLIVTDDNGLVQNFGPFSKEQESISGNVILGTRPEGSYTVVMVGQTNDGMEIRKESSMHLIHNPEPKSEALRFSVLFDFDRFKSVAVYEKFLSQVVAPLVMDNSTVIIHGHTDIIGQEDYNMKLSQQRAKDAKDIIERAVIRLGKTGIKYEVLGFGADLDTAPFENKRPEERFYNRTVIIDIIPND